MTWDATFGSEEGCHTQPLPQPMSNGGVFLTAAMGVVSPYMLMSLSVLSTANLPVVTLLIRLEPPGDINGLGVRVLLVVYL